MKWPSFESLIVTFVTFLALSPCMIYFMTAADDNGNNSSIIIIKNLFYLGMNLTLVSAILWAIHKKFMEDPPPCVPTFYRKRKQFQQSRQHSSTSSNQGRGGKDGDANSSKRRYFRKNKRFRQGKSIKLSKWVSRKRPCGKRLFVGYLGIIMSLITTATAVPVMVEALENTDGYSDNLQSVTCLELLSFLSIPFLAVAVYRYYSYTENRQQQPSSSSSIHPKMRLPCLDTVFVYCMALVIFSPCSLSLAIAVDMNNRCIKNYFALGFFLISVSVISWVVSGCCSGLEMCHNKLLLLKAKEEEAAAALTQADRFHHLTDHYSYNGKTVMMNKRRRCSKTKKSDIDGNPEETIMLGEELPLEYTADGASFTSLPPEMRGITLRQLRAIWEMAEEKCVEENWVDKWTGQPVTPDTVNLYHINEYIVKPYTKRTKRSFVESLPSTAGSQPPVWFVSHWWGESFRHTLDCIETLAIDFKHNWNDEDDSRGGGLTEDTPIWICIFANNQWALDDDMATDPQESSFTRAMRVARFRTMSILDANAKVFTRIWCVYELFLTLMLRKDDPSVPGLWVIYTALRHTGDGWNGDEDRVAVGIIPGRAPSELSGYTSLREKHFPPELVSKSRSIDIASAIASVPADGIRILNSIVKSKDLNASPPTTHAKYDELNESVKAAFVSSEGALVAAHKAGGEEWKSTLAILSKGKMTGTFKLHFDQFKPCFTPLEARELVSHVPLTCTGLKIEDEYENETVGEGAIDGMLEWLEKKEEASSLTYLGCANCYAGDWGDKEKGRAAGSRLAALLKSNHAQSMERLIISNTDLIDSGNVSDWKSALEAMPNLKKLSFFDGGLSRDEKDILRNATNASYVIIS